VVGSGGVGCAIAASLAAAGVARLALYDVNAASSEALAQRLQKHYPALQVDTGDKDPAGFDLVVNATPLGMNEGDPLPIDVSRLEARTFACCSSRSRPTWNSSACPAPLPKNCAPSRRSDFLFPTRERRSPCLPPSPSGRGPG